jgi:hypothetical protein
VAAVVAPSRPALAQTGPACAATPVAAYAPTATAWQFAGRGYQVSHPVSVRPVLVFVTVAAPGGTHLHVTLRNYPTGDWLGVDLAQDGPVTGTLAQTVPTAGQYVVAVEADGDWTITLGQP